MKADDPVGRISNPAVEPGRIGNSAYATREDPWIVRWSLTLFALGVITVLVIVPVVHVFAQALADGLGVYWDQLLASRETRHAILLTLIVAPIAVIFNTIFGVAAAWAIARFRFPGRTMLITLIDLPFAISPVVAGLVFVLLFGANGFFGGVVEATGIRVINALPGLILATAFVTFPFVARELIPILEAIGPEEELAALSLGAGAADLLARDAAEHQMGPALRRHSLQRPRHGRIRGGLRGLGPHPGADADHPARSRASISGLRHHAGGFCAGVVADFARISHPASKDPIGA